ncbi:MAG TPA: class I SAM-dependent methyltransferase [Jatrophihabitantaceae bacterium]|nr:class I SAM-dependent methyltransferase [Jatrophihabitantaceae bacterium]
MTALQQWRAQLAGWAIPPEIEALAQDPPWGFPPELFRAGPESPDTPSRDVALLALPDGGSVLDIGCGGGAASLALAPPAARITGVDNAAGMLESFTEAARDRGVDAVPVTGTWPDAATDVEAADVVVCHHVLYNVADVPPFVTALTAKAKRRVVVELTAEHPLVTSRPLWQHFHGLDRPTGPTADLAVAVLAELGLSVEQRRWSRPPRHVKRAAYVDLYRRRLCLPRGSEPQVDAALGPTDWPRDVVTLWWDV